MAKTAAGALATSAEQLGAVGDAVMLTCVFKIGGTDKLLAIPATLRNVHVGNSEADVAEGSFHHGLEFDLKDQDAFFALQGFVYEQIVKTQTE